MSDHPITRTVYRHTVDHLSGDRSAKGRCLEVLRFFGHGEATFEAICAAVLQARNAAVDASPLYEGPSTLMLSISRFERETMKQQMSVDAVCSFLTRLAPA